MTITLNKGDTRLIINECKKNKLSIEKASYVLATTHHEVGPNMKPVRETFATSDAQAIARLTKAFKAGKLGGVKSDYWSGGFFGRGYPQVTHEENYRAASKVVGVDLVKNPERMLEPLIAIPVMLHGMINGTFRKGQTLERYINDKSVNYYSARNIINGDLKKNGHLIASYAREYERLLRNEGYKVSSSGSKPKVPLSLETELLMMPETSTLLERYPTEQAWPYMRKVIFAVQSHLTSLNYPMGGLDGKIGPLTKEAISAAQKDNKIPSTGEINQLMIKSILAWPVRTLSPERENVTPARVEVILPEGQSNAIARWRAKIGAWFGGGITTIGVAGKAIENTDLISATGTAKSIMANLKEYLPSTSLIVISVIFLLVLYFVIRATNKTTENLTEAVKSSARR